MNKILELLNMLLRYEPDAINALVSYRVQVRSEEVIINSPICVLVGPDGSCSMGLLGILNALIERKDGLIAAVYNGSDIVRFEIVRVESRG